MGITRNIVCRCVQVLFKVKPFNRNAFSQTTHNTIRIHMIVCSTAHLIFAKLRIKKIWIWTSIEWMAAHCSAQSNRIELNKAKPHYVDCSTWVWQCSICAYLVRYQMCGSLLLSVNRSLIAFHVLSNAVAVVVVVRGCCFDECLDLIQFATII